MKSTIREPTSADIPALAALHVQAWNDTYPQVQKPPTLEIRQRQWIEQFTITDGSWFCFVAENAAGELVGFAKGERYASGDLPEYDGELNKIYVLKAYHRQGLGRRLLEHVIQRFLKQGITSMVLFGTPNNPACAFHEKHGGQKLFAKNGEFHGGYGWKDLRATEC